MTNRTFIDRLIKDAGIAEAQASTPIGSLQAVLAFELKGLRGLAEAIDSVDDRLSRLGNQLSEECVDNRTELVNLRRRVKELKKAVKKGQ